MKRRSNLRILLLFGGLCFIYACQTDNGTNNSTVNVSGTWAAPVFLQTCTPTDVCSDAGFTQGKSANAIMKLTQDGSKVEGTYTYEGVGIEADVKGSVSGNQLVLDGSVSNPLGKVTVHLTGPATTSEINASVSHKVNLADGRSGTVTGTGTFVKQ